jgi:hypothetical protein
MSEYTAPRIRKPYYFRLSPLTRGRGNRLPYIIGFDSESEQQIKAEKGKPFLFQFAHPDGSCDLVDIGLERNAGLEEFCLYIFDHCKDRNVEYIVFGFNLQYEWTQLFRDLPDDVKDASMIGVAFTIRGSGITISITAMNDKRYMLTMVLGGTKRRVKFIDAMAYFPMSLNAASQIIGAGAKLPKPQEFSRRTAHLPENEAYAKQDAILTQRLGEYIIDLHTQYDVASTMSAPHFAARTFRKRYLSNEIPLPSETLEQYGLDSYHGGKNGFYLPKPTFIRNVWHYDIRSAYPEAMRQLPNVELARWKSTDCYVPNTHAIYEITGSYTGCNHRAFMQRATGWVAPGTFYRLRVTGYELDAALALGEVTISECYGWIFDGPSGGPLVEYVDDFYSMKRNAKSEAERATAKLFLNSLYGKFFQKTPCGNVTEVDLETGEIIKTDPSQDYDYEAGGLYHPPIASLITGYVRAKIHALEHKYDAMMTSTDGFFARNAPDPNDLGDELGQLSAELGSLRIWRERLYIFHAYKSKRDTYALHGFRGSVVQLKRMPLIAGNTYTYTADAMVTLKMSLRSFNGERYAPGEFTTLTFQTLLPKINGP